MYCTVISEQQHHAIKNDYHFLNVLSAKIKWKGQKADQFTAYISINNLFEVFKCVSFSIKTVQTREFMMQSKHQNIFDLRDVSQGTNPAMGCTYPVCSLCLSQAWINEEGCVRKLIRYQNK